MSSGPWLDGPEPDWDEVDRLARLDALLERPEVRHELDEFDEFLRGEGDHGG